MKQSLSKKAVPYLFIAPTFILIFIFSYFAIFIAFKSSFQDYTMGYKAIWNGFTNYIKLFQDQIFLTSLVNQILITVTAVVFNVFFPLFAAELLFFIRHKKLADGIKTAFVIPMLVPGIVTILIWRYLYNPIFGFNSFLQALGLKNLQQDWLNTSSTALWSIIFVGFPFVSGLYFLIFHSGLNAIGQELHEAAIIDGAKNFDIIRKIHMPSVLPYINVVFTLSLIGSLSGFGLVAATTGGGPGYSSMIPSMYMYKVAFGDGNMGYASAMGVIIFIIIIILTLMSRLLFSSKSKKEES
jgi:raffinose/stachyose/melibiose transport system permease protein